jgi:hypothetical protein
MQPDQRNNRGININTIINLMQAYEYDLIIKYHIYRQRGCNDIKPGFSKNKIFFSAFFFSFTVIKC